MTASKKSLFQRLFGYRFHRDHRRDGGDVYLRRWHLLKTRPLSIYLHKIQLPDEDPWLHTHPWPKMWRVLFGRGHYWEEVPGLPGQPNQLRHNTDRIARVPERHRIIALGDGKPVWTLFVGIKTTGQWGFEDPATKQITKWHVRLRERGGAHLLQLEDEKDRLR
jgi:hypothetical protein